MTTQSKPSDRIHPEHETAGPSRFQRPTDSIDPALVTQTRNQIRLLVQEISELADSPCAPQEFYQGFLTRITNALGAVGGAIWQIGTQNNLELKFQINLAQTGLTADANAQHRHAQLLTESLAAGEPVIVPPQSGDPGAASGNPTDHLLIIGPLCDDQRALGLVEVFQRAGAGPTTQRGYLRFAGQMCEIAASYFKGRRLRELAEQQQSWQRVEQFIRAIHASLDLNSTIYAIANESRPIVACDRVSVAVRRGSRFEIAAVSGLDTVERRAEQVKLLSTLVTAVSKSRRPFWYTAETGELPPQIEKPLQRYVDSANVKALGVVPLLRTSKRTAGESSTGTSAPLAAMVFEQLTRSGFEHVGEDRIPLVVAHGADAFHAAWEHQSILFLPLWRALGSLWRIVAGRNALRNAVAAAVTVGAVLALWIIPYPFRLGAQGQLLPTTRFEIFAPADGILKSIEIPTDPEAIVEPGQVLMVMENNDLQVAIKDLQGQQSQWEERIRNLQRGLGERMERLEKLQIERDLAEANALLASVQNQLHLKNQELEQLTIRAPARGQVVNWQLRQNLLRRPVQTGQNLLSVVDPRTEWELELELPERRVAHFLQTSESSPAPLQVRFTLASHPGRQFVGQVIEIDRRLEVRGDRGNCMLIRATFDKRQLPAELLKTGTRVTAQLDCGHRSLGYVWFHELMETIQATWTMRL